MSDVLEKLTDSEREVLGRIMKGDVNTKIAADLDMGLRTVELRRHKIAEKFKAKTWVDVIRIAIASGL